MYWKFSLQLKLFRFYSFYSNSNSILVLLNGCWNIDERWTNDVVVFIVSLFYLKFTFSSFCVYAMMNTWYGCYVFVMKMMVNIEYVCSRNVNSRVSYLIQWNHCYSKFFSFIFVSIMVWCDVGFVHLVHFFIKKSKFPLVF